MGLERYKHCGDSDGLIELNRAETECHMAVVEAAGPNKVMESKIQMLFYIDHSL